eukprot:scaffold10460_cov90-Isochrysis_galbana.AAC.1
MPAGLHDFRPCSRHCHHGWHTGSVDQLRGRLWPREALRPPCALAPGAAGRARRDAPRCHLLPERADWSSGAAAAVGPHAVILARLRHRPRPLPPDVKAAREPNGEGGMHKAPAAAGPADLLMPLWRRRAWTSPPHVHTARRPFGVRLPHDLHNPHDSARTSITASA